MIRVLFVCLGNICRSPMAEAVFRQKVQQAKLGQAIQIDSAGTGDWHIGKPPHHGTRTILEKNSIHYDGMRARQIEARDLLNFDYIIAMDEQNTKDIELLGEAPAGTTVARLLDYLPDQKVRDVPDPYFTGNFDYVYELIEASCQRLLDHIVEQKF